LDYCLYLSGSFLDVKSDGKWRGEKNSNKKSRKLPVGHFATLGLVFTEKPLKPSPGV
jgi:hypothetical protein